MYTVGIDLGGTNIAAGLVKDGQQILRKASLPTAMPRSAEEVAEDITRLAVQVTEPELAFQELAFIGVGVPGSADYDKGIVEYANNIGFTNVPLAAMLREKLQKDVFLENDANAAAIAEFRAMQKECRNFVMITLGTGIGAAMILNGEVVRGAHFAAGEIGHNVIQMDGPLCSCGRRGCWEMYASVTGLIAQTKAAMKQAPSSKMWDLCSGSLSAVSGRTAFDAMRQGDEQGIAVVRQYVQYVACGIVNTVNTFDPEAVCIGGGISKEGETLLEPLRSAVAKEFYSRNSSEQPKIFAAALGNDAGILGAAILKQGR